MQSLEPENIILDVSHFLIHRNRNVQITRDFIKQLFKNLIFFVTGSSTNSMNGHLTTIKPEIKIYSEEKPDTQLNEKVAHL